MLLTILQNSQKVPLTEFLLLRGSALHSAALLKKGHGHRIQRNFSEKLFSRTTSAI